MAKKLNWEEIQNFPRLHVPQTLMNRVRKQSKKQGVRIYEVGVDVIKAGLAAKGY